MGNLDDADEAVRLPWLESDSRQFDGKPITVGIQSSTRSGPFLKTKRWYQKYLVVIAKTYQGKTLAKMIEVPDMADRVTIELP